MLSLLDGFLTLLHFTIILFNLLGWIPPFTRKAHLVSILLTAASWFLLGLWFGIGYCPITEWQWNIKEQLGETNLPASFIKYYGDKITNNDLDAGMIDRMTAGCFAGAAMISLFLNLRKKISRNIPKKSN